MSDQLFEVAFSGEISAGAELDEVRARVAKIFNADEAKLAQLFSGKRIVIKKNIDHATAMKYKTALNRAGAECEISPPADAAPVAAVAGNTAAAAVASGDASTESGSSDDSGVLTPPQTDPLGITGDQIEDLAVSIAPVGSQLLDEHKQPEEPEIDLSGLDVAPVGSDLSTAPKAPDPAPPDTSGISMKD